MTSNGGRLPSQAGSRWRVFDHRFDDVYQLWVLVDPLGPLDKSVHVVIESAGRGVQLGESWIWLDERVDGHFRFEVSPAEGPAVHAGQRTAAAPSSSPSSIPPSSASTRNKVRAARTCNLYRRLSARHFQLAHLESQVL